MRRRIYIAGFAVAIVVSSILINASVGMRNWSKVTEKQSRVAVHSLLGKPYASFLPKGWEGWHHAGIVGAWVIIIYYDEMEKVTHVSQKFDWGLGYLFW